MGYKLFGVSTVVPHAIIAVSAIIALYFTFLLGKKLFDPEVGFFASLLLFFSALFFAQSESFVAAVPLTALALSTIYFFLDSNVLGYYTSASLLVLTKEPGILVLVAIVVYEVLVNVRIYNLKKFAFRILFLLSPLSYFFLWMIGNKLFLGWFLWPHHTTLYTGVVFPILGLKYILYHSFLDDFRFLILLPLLLGLLNGTRRKQLIKREFLLFILLVILFTVFFWSLCGTARVVTDYEGFSFLPLPRYYLLLQPLFFISGTAAIIKLIGKKLLYYAAFVIIICLFIISWTPPFIELGGENDLNHRYMILVQRQAAQYLAKEHSSTPLVVAYWLESAFTQTYLGYVSEPLNVITLGKATNPTPLKSIDEVTTINNLIKYLELKENAIFVSYEWTYDMKDRLTYINPYKTDLKKAVNEGKLKIIETFEIRSGRVTIYSLP